MSQFDKILEDFDNTLRQYNNVNYEKLQPPLPSQEIELLLQKIGMTDNDIFLLYNWKNGSSDESELPMIFPFECTMLSLENVIKFFDDKNELVSMNGLVNLFDNSEECFLFNKNFGENYGKLHLYSVPLLSIETPYPYYDSISTMFETTIQQYKKGGLFYDKEKKYLFSNTEVNIEIYKKLNPLSGFYNQ